MIYRCQRDCAHQGKKYREGDFVEFGEAPPTRYFKPAETDLTAPVAFADAGRPALGFMEAMKLLAEKGIKTK